jgi:hypothetical protein
MDDKATAREIADNHFTDGSHERLTNAIVAALEEARSEVTDAADLDVVAPEPTQVETWSASLLRQAKEVRGIIDCTGKVPVVRRVLGTLPVTADGCVAAPGGIIWPQMLIDNDEGGRVAWSLYDICTGDTCDDGEWLAAKCYSTPEAAKAAMEGGTRD